MKPYSTDLLCYRIVKNVHKVNSITILGVNHKFLILTEEERHAFIEAGLRPTNCTYERMIKDNVKYHAKCYTRQGEKSNDSIVRLSCGGYAVIERILLLSDRDSATTLCVYSYPCFKH